MGPRERNAKAFAEKYHAGQMYGDMPYISHVEEVVALVSRYPEDVRIIAWLHDVIEDSGIDRHTIHLLIAEEFGEYVARGVLLLSDDEDLPNRKAKKKATNMRLSLIADKEELGFLVVKIADRLANLRRSVINENHRLIKLYRSEADAFRMAAYRNGLSDHLWEYMDSYLAQD